MVRAADRTAALQSLKTFFCPHSPSYRHGFARAMAGPGTPMLFSHHPTTLYPSPTAPFPVALSSAPIPAPTYDWLFLDLAPARRTCETIPTTTPFSAALHSALPFMLNSLSAPTFDWPYLDPAPARHRPRVRPIALCTPYPLLSSRSAWIFLDRRGYFQTMNPYFRHTCERHEAQRRQRRILRPLRMRQRSPKASLAPSPSPVPSRMPRTSRPQPIFGCVHC